MQETSNGAGKWFSKNLAALAFGISLTTGAGVGGGAALIDWRLSVLERRVEQLSRVQSLEARLSAIEENLRQGEGRFTQRDALQLKREMLLWMELSRQQRKDVLADLK